jgi:hypothetical protein
MTEIQAAHYRAQQRANLISGGASAASAATSAGSCMAGVMAAFFGLLAFFG